MANPACVYDGVGFPKDVNAMYRATDQSGCFVMLRIRLVSASDFLLELASIYLHIQQLYMQYTTINKSCQVLISS